MDNFETTPEAEGKAVVVVKVNHMVSLMVIQISAPHHWGAYTHDICTS